MEDNEFLKLFSLLVIILLAIMGAYASVVTGTGLPSANNDLHYKYFTVSFIDYCPLCGANNCLVGLANKHMRDNGLVGIA